MLLWIRVSSRFHQRSGGVVRLEIRGTRAARPVSRLSEVMGVFHIVSRNFTTKGTCGKNLELLDFPVLDWQRLEAHSLSVPRV